MTRLFAMLIVLVTATAVHAADESPNVMSGTIFQAFATFVIFLLLFAILRLKAWGPILRGLQDREGKIRNDLQTAEESAKAAQATLARYQQQLAVANDEARKIIEQGKIDAQKLAASLKEQTQAEITTMRQRAMEQIKTARENALSDIYAQAAVLATDVAGRILQRELTPQDRAALVERSLNDMAQQNN